MDMSKSFGIYMIRNTITGAQYIGMTRKSFDERWRGHRTALAKGQHASPSLQTDWNQYGEEVFQFSIVEVVENVRQVGDRENHWIQQLKPTYNTVIGRSAGRPPKNILRVELRLNADDPVVVALEREAEERGVTIQEHIVFILTERYFEERSRPQNTPRPVNQELDAGGAGDLQWVWDATAEIAQQKGISQSELLLRIAREWLLSRATDVLR